MSSNANEKRSMKIVNCYMMLWKLATVNSCVMKISSLLIKINKGVNIKQQRSAK